MPNNILLLRNVLAYDSFVGSDLTVSERILIHQYIAQGTAFKAVLSNKIQRIAKAIKQECWQAPENRYKEHSHNATKVLEVYNSDTEEWEPFKQPTRKQKRKSV